MQTKQTNLLASQFPRTVAPSPMKAEPIGADLRAKIAHRREQMKRDGRATHGEKEAARLRAVHHALHVALYANARRAAAARQTLARLLTETERADLQTSRFAREVFTCSASRFIGPFPAARGGSRTLGARAVNSPRDAREAAARGRDPMQRALASLGASVAEKRARKDSRVLGRERLLSEEAASAAALALAQKVARRPRLLAIYRELFARVASGLHARPSFIGPVRPRKVCTVFPLSIWKAAHRAADKALRRMARESASEAATLATRAADEGATLFDATGATLFDATGSYYVPPHEGEEAARVAADLAQTQIRLVAADLRARILERGARTKRDGRAARSHLARLDKWTERALAFARGEATGEGAPVCVVTKAESAGEVRERLTVRDKRGRVVASDGKGGATGSRKARCAGASVLYAKEFDALRRLRAFIA